MEVKFYHNASDDRTVNKDLLEETVFEGVLRDESDIMNPIIRFDSTDVIRFNFCYIPDFRRYYFVKSVNAYRRNLYDVTMSVDVLMSFRGDIVQLTGIIDKQSMPENGDEYIDDGSLVTENETFSTTYNYPNGFNDTPEYILITAG